MSLTLEEKQRLAKEQEQAAKLRNQQPLAPQSIKPANTSNTKVTPQNTCEHKTNYGEATEGKTNVEIHFSKTDLNAFPSSNHDLSTGEKRFASMIFLKPLIQLVWETFFIFLVDKWLLLPHVINRTEISWFISR